MAKNLMDRHGAASLDELRRHRAAQILAEGLQERFLSDSDEFDEDCVPSDRDAMVRRHVRWAREDKAEIFGLDSQNGNGNGNGNGRSSSSGRRTGEPQHPCVLPDARPRASHASPRVSCFPSTPRGRAAQATLSPGKTERKRKDGSHARWEQNRSDEAEINRERARGGRGPRS